MNFAFSIDMTSSPEEAWLSFSEKVLELLCHFELQPWIALECTLTLCSCSLEKARSIHCSCAVAKKNAQHKLHSLGFHSVTISRCISAAVTHARQTVKVHQIRPTRANLRVDNCTTLHTPRLTAQVPRF